MRPPGDLADSLPAEGRGRLRERISEWVRARASVHLPGGAPVLVVTTPRSGSTWLMELIWGQPGFKAISEPLDLRRAAVRRVLGIRCWEELYAATSAERVEAYLRGLAEGRLRFLDPSPRLRHWRPVTRRVVLKLLHGCEDRIPRLEEALGARVVLLLRHPIPVSLSRRELPRLRAFLASDYAAHFHSEELAFARRLAERGDALERAVLDWTLQNALPLRMHRPSWLVLSYEQLVLEPAPLLRRLAAHLDLPRPQRLETALARPSLTTRKSERSTAEVLRRGAGPERQRYLVERWRERIPADREAALLEIPARLGVGVYRPGSALPAPPVWHGPHPEAELR